MNASENIRKVIGRPGPSTISCKPVATRNIGSVHTPTCQVPGPRGPSWTIQAKLARGEGEGYEVEGDAGAADRVVARERTMEALRAGHGATPESGALNAQSQSVDCPSGPRFASAAPTT